MRAHVRRRKAVDFSDHIKELRNDKFDRKHKLAQIEALEVRSFEGR